MKRLTFQLALAILSLLAASTKAHTQGFTVGTASADITPLNNGFPRMFLAGYASRGAQPATGVSAYPVRIRVLTIKDSFSQKVIVAADVLGFTRELHEQILTLTQQQYGIQPQDLILGASHTHAGPVLKDNLDPAVAYGLNASDLAIVATYTNWLRDKIVATIGQALTQATPANAYYGVGLATDLAAYRTRTPEHGRGDKTPRPEVPVLVFRDVSNRVLASVFSYACHPTYNGDLNYHGDWPGIMEAQLEQRYPGSVALFWQGAAGDLDPNTNLFPTVDSAGSAMANIVAGVINGQGRQIAAPISTSYRRINLPLDVYNQGVTVNDKDQETATHRLLRSSYQPIADSGPFPNNLHAQQMLNAIDTYSLPDSEPLPILVWYAPPGSFNNPLIMVVTGGELVVGYATAIKAQTPPPGGDPNNVWVSAYANEVPGYIASDEYLWDWETTGGYESGWDNVWGIQVAAGSQLYYGNPARLLPSTINSDGVFVPGVEQILLKTVSNMIAAVPK